MITGALIVDVWADKMGWTLKIWMYPALILLVIIGWVVLGFLDTKSGFREAEILNNQKNAPITMKMFRMIEKIYKDKYESS